MDDFSNANNQADNKPVRYAVEMDCVKARKMAKHMKFIAIVNIALGAIMCLAMNLILGILGIIAGMRLNSAADKLKSVLCGAPNYIAESIGEDIMEYYKKMGIGIIINIISTVLMFFMLSLIYDAAYLAFNVN